MRNIVTLVATLIGILMANGAFAAIYPYSHTACIGAATGIALSDSTITGGTWSSSNTSIGTINATSGLFTGIAAGTTTIVYTGSIIASAIFTVYPIPAAITGGGSTPFCAGTSIALSNPTSGGTWGSSSTYVATVGSLTGVVTGMHGGTSDIYYIMGGSCYASITVTVTGLPDDTVSGPSVVCVGGTISLSSIASGGSWTSSSPAIATVSGTGVVAGITSGTAIISHSVSGTCGTTVTTRTITVASTTTPATITGTPGVGIGYTTSLYASTGGGTWSSSSSSIATVSSSGLVTGVAAGTTVITYTISGCGGPASTYASITVTIPNCISGDILFTGIPYTGYVRVWLIKYDPSTLMLTSSAFSMVYSSGSSAHYSFCGMGTDSFRVKASCDTITPGTGYTPTYHTSSPYWHSASVIYHVSGTNDINKHITMGYGTTTFGPGFVGGNVTTGANKGTAGAPAVGLLMYCVKSTGEILQQTYTDASGNYSFSSLPTDVAMTVHPELINYATTEFPTFTLTTAAPGKTAANFIQRTVSMKIEPLATSVENIASAGAAINVFPNPASSTLNIQWNTANAGTGTITIADVTGRQVLNATVDMSNASGISPINISGISNGIYMMNIKANGVNYNAKVEVK